VSATSPPKTDRPHDFVFGKTLDPLDVRVALVELLDRRPAWQRDAACREHPLELFFPTKGVRPDAARAICARCLVREECAAFAATFPADDVRGVWAGRAYSGRRGSRARFDA
jgi:hypothetical protein